MTDYIEEMMKTAGVTEGDMPNRIGDMEYSYWVTMGYPYFSAEKQLQIIKLISVHDLDITQNTAGTYSLLTSFFYVGTFRDKDFTQALAQLTTKLINAGKLDKEKVKEILKK